MLTDRNLISISGISTSSAELGAGVVNELCSKSPRVTSVGCTWYPILTSDPAATGEPTAKKSTSPSATR